MTNSLRNITESLLAAASAAGADQADAIASRGQSLSVDVFDGKLDHAEQAEGTEAGLRVFIGQKQALVSASDMRPDVFSQMAERAVAMAKEAPDDPHAGLAEPGDLASSFDVAPLQICDPAPAPTPDELQQNAHEAESAALQVSGVTQVQSASAGYGRHAVHLAASNGFSGGYERSNRALSCVAITGHGTGMERDYFADLRVYQSDLLTAEFIGRTAAQRAVARAGAQKPPTGKFPVLFDERVSNSLIGHVLAAINGAAVARGSSWLLDKLGQQILPAGLSVVEDPLRARVSGSRPFDGEGLPTGQRDIIRDGVLTGWVLDLATARQLGMRSTANAARGVSAPPSPSVSNIALTEGPQSRDDLLADMGTGLLVTSLIGATINPNTGDYSRGAAGFWVENGAVQYPVNECTIAGNLHDMLLAIIPANDAQKHLRQVVPSLLVDGMSIAGK